MKIVNIKIRNIGIILLGVGIFSLPVLSQTPTKFTAFTVGGNWLADDGIHIDAHGGNIIYVEHLKTYFWYGEHRGTPRGASCYSSKDLYNWKKEGVVMEKGSIPIFERPKVIYNKKKDEYIMWFHYDGPLNGSGYGIAEQGVAVSKKPTGPFVLKDHRRPNGHESRDIGMYIDPETEKAYIGYAADHTNKTVRMVELSEDYLSHTTNDVDIKAHCEGPGILKKDGNFYLLTSQCSGWKPNPGTYYTASSIMGPYSSHGSPFINDVDKNSFNSQPCYIFKIPGYKDAFLYMGDRWNGGGKPESQYVFLPITISQSGKMEIRFVNKWDLSVFEKVVTVSNPGATFGQIGNNTSVLTSENFESFDLSGKKISLDVINHSDFSYQKRKPGLQLLTTESGNILTIMVRPAIK